MHTGPLFDEKILVFQQTRSFVIVDIEISTPNGQVVGEVRTAPSQRRFRLLGPRLFELTDNNGTVHAVIEDVVDFGRDTFDVNHPDGRRLATLERGIFNMNRIGLTLADGTKFDMQGDIIGGYFDIVREQTYVARVSRDFGGCAAWLSQTRRYELEFKEPVTYEMRLALMGAVVAFTVAKYKDDNST